MRSLSLLGHAIREIREQRGMTVRELAGAAKVEENQIVAVEAGTLDPDFELMLKLAASVGVRASAFVLRAEELAGRRSGR